MDRLLLPFLLTSDESEADYLLADLIYNHAVPAVENIVRSTFGWSGAWERNYGDQQTQDVEDIVGEVSVKILERLRRLKKSPERAAINDFRGYVAVTAYNTCNDYVRGKYPSWYRLRNKLRYTLTHHPDFGLWEEADGEKICGLSEWNEQERPPNNGWINEARMDTEWYIKRGHTDDVIELLRAAFSSAKAPIRMEGLVSLVAEILNITDGPHVNHVQLEYMKPSDLPTYFVDPVDVEGRRLTLKCLWKQIVQLPKPQRLALLLAVRDEGHTSVTLIFAEICIASFREIAQAVDMSANEFTQILPDLPLNDKTIGKRLGVSRKKGHRLPAFGQAAPGQADEIDWPKPEAKAERLSGLVFVGTHLNMLQVSRNPRGLDPACCWMS